MAHENEGSEWFEITIKVKVRHVTAHAAEMHIVDLLSASLRFYPVAVVNAEPCVDPTVRPSEGSVNAPE